jgi:hypothetical protein
VAAFIAAQRVQHGVPHAAACRALGMSQSWFYKWAGSTPPPRAARRDRLKAEVARLFREHEGKCEAPRITVSVRSETDHVAVTVRDDGPGFDQACHLPGFGIREILGRQLEEVGGTGEVQSLPGDGTQVRITVPKMQQA